MSTEMFERKLTAILSADVKGYSRLMRMDEDETVRTLTAYRKAIAGHVVKYRGRVVDSPGDNLLAEFGSGLDAVNCAVEVQRELAERNKALPPERQMEFRIGVNSGDVIPEGERIYGDGVNIAARVEGLAEGGGISISGTVYDSIEGKLGLEFEYQGTYEVKNIDKPIRVYRVLFYPGAAAHRVVKAKEAVGRFWRNVVLVMTALLMVGAGAVAFWHFYLRAPRVEPASEKRMAYPLPEEPSIAVLPFENMSRDPKQKYFTDGLTEEIITSLSRIPHMFVIARNSTFTYKGKPVKVQQVAEELGVRYILEGSVRKSGDRVRITAQLIDALTGRHLWAERYDRELKDLFALQDDITLNILKALEVKLSPGTGQGLTEKGTESLDAYLKLLAALASGHRGTKEGNITRRKLSEEAIALDPEYPRAYLMLSATHLMDILYGTGESPEKSLKMAEELVKKALSLNDNSAWGHAFLGRIYLTQREYEKAIAEGERALSLNPNSDFVQAALAYTLRNAGKPERAVALMKRAIRLNPSRLPGTWVFWAHLTML